MTTAVINVITFTILVVNTSLMRKLNPESPVPKFLFRASVAMWLVCVILLVVTLLQSNPSAVNPAPSNTIYHTGAQPF